MSNVNLYDCEKKNYCCTLDNNVYSMITLHQLWMDGPSIKFNYDLRKYYVYRDTIWKV